MEKLNSKKFEKFQIENENLKKIYGGGEATTFCKYYTVAWKTEDCDVYDDSDKA